MGALRDSTEATTERGHHNPVESLWPGKFMPTSGGRSYIITTRYTPVKLLLRAYGTNSSRAGVDTVQDSKRRWGTESEKWKNI